MPPPRDRRALPALPVRCCRDNRRVPVRAYGDIDEHLNREVFRMAPSRAIARAEADAGVCGPAWMSHNERASRSGSPASICDISW